MCYYTWTWLANVCFFIALTNSTLLKHMFNTNTQLVLHVIVFKLLCNGKVRLYKKWKQSSENRMFFVGIKVLSV